MRKLGDGEGPAGEPWAAKALPPRAGRKSSQWADCWFLASGLGGARQPPWHDMALTRLREWWPATRGGHLWRRDGPYNRRPACHLLPSPPTARVAIELPDIEKENRRSPNLNSRGFEAASGPDRTSQVIKRKDVNGIHVSTGTRAQATGICLMPSTWIQGNITEQSGAFVRLPSFRLAERNTPPHREKRLRN
jgi:hypothetical protein